MTKSDQKHVNQLKINKNQQKSSKQKKVKKWKIRKSRKVTKSEKWKNTKTVKSEMWKTWKMIKNWPPLKKAKMSLKWPKTALCEIRAAWSGVFWVPGGTTGPGFKAGFRPPLFLHIFDQFLTFYTFVICTFCWFLRFHKLVKVTFLWWVTFFDRILCNVIRP